MPDGFATSVDATTVLAMFDRIGASADFVCREVGRETAKRIVAEAQARLRRAVSDAATGETEAGIHWELTYDGKGYVVLAYDKNKAQGERWQRRTAGFAQRISRRQVAHVDLYLEYGTVKMYARPFFFSSADLESPGHLRRLTEALQQFLDDVGR